eukprot:PhM_4_TR13650/c0_g1_i1/m.15875
MKFGEQFGGIQIPEWRRMYVDYAGLKALIADISNEMPKRVIQTHSIVIDEFDLSDISRLHPRSARGVFVDPNTKQRAVFHVSLETRGERHRRRRTMAYAKAAAAQQHHLSPAHEPYDDESTAETLTAPPSVEQRGGSGEIEMHEVPKIQLDGVSPSTDGGLHSGRRSMRVVTIENITPTSTSHTAPPVPPPHNNSIDDTAFLEVYNTSSLHRAPSELSSIGEDPDRPTLALRNMSIQFADLDDPWDADFAPILSDAELEALRDDPKECLLAIANTVAKANQQFGRWLTSELTKVNRFYRSQAQFFSGRVAQVIDKAKKVENMTKGQKATLVRSMEEAFHALDLLLMYCQLNHVAFCKAFRKYEKNTRQRNLLKLLEHHLEAQEYYMEQGANPITRLQKEVTAMLAHVAYGDDVKACGNVLRRVPHEQRERQAARRNLHSSFLLGTTLVFFLVSTLLYADAVRNIDNKQVLPNSLIDRAAYIFGLTFVVVLMFALFGIDVLIWEAVGVNYAFILEMDARRHYDASSVIRKSLFAMLLLSICIFGYCYTSVMRATIFADDEVDSSANDTFVYLSPIFVLLQIGVLELMPGALHWLSRTFWRILLVPRWSVHFADFFIADQTHSVVSVVTEFQFSMCIWDNLDSGTDHACTTLKDYNIPYLAIVPHMWRFLQCLRRFYDQQNKSVYHPNVTNAGKYFLGICALLCAFAFRIAKVQYNNEINNDSVITAETVWLMVATADSTSKLLWDVFMDWGCLCVLRKSEHWQKTDHPLLRPNRLYPVWLYYLAIVYDVLARYCWLPRYYFLKKYRHPHGSETARFFLSTWWGFLVFAVVEVVRRFIWNIIRMENEQLNNIESYRAVAITPPPFHDHPVELVFEETDAEIEERLSHGGLEVEQMVHSDDTSIGGGGTSLTKSIAGSFAFDGINHSNRTRITTFFAMLPEEEKAKVLNYLNPEGRWTARKNTGKSIYFSQQHEEDKVRGLLHVFGRLTLVEYVEKYNIFQLNDPAEPEQKQIDGEGKGHGGDADGEAHRRVSLGNRNSNNNNNNILNDEARRLSIQRSLTLPVQKQRASMKK